MAQNGRKSLEELKEEIAARGGVFGMSENADEEETRRFLESVIADEEGEGEPLTVWLVRAGYSPPPAAGLDDAALTGELQALIRHLAFLGVYLERTDHLSDRELYTWITEEELHQPEVLFPGNPNFAMHLDVLGGCSEEDLQLNLIYYADEEERKDWAERFRERIPPRKPRPFDRDRFLPQPSRGL